MKQASQVHVFTDLHRFSELRAGIDKQSDAVTSEVAKEFEALFIEMMLSSARKASLEGGLFDSHALKLYREMFDTQAARILAEQGALGFADSIGNFIQQVTGTTGEQPNPPSDDVPGRHAARELRLPSRRVDIPIPSILPVAETSDSDPPQPMNWTREALFPQPAPVRAASQAVPSMPGIGERQRRFVQHLWPHAEQAAAKLGTTPSVIVAQAALETGWGAHIIPGNQGDSSNNLFGIKANKAWRGRSTNVQTFEFLGGRPIKTNAMFRTYDHIADSFADYVSFVQENPRYQRALENASNPDSYIRELARAGYATDPRYARKIIAIRKQIEPPISPVVQADASKHANERVSNNAVPVSVQRELN